MFIPHLEAENFKRLFAINIDLPAEGGLIEICGQNANGKTSAIDAIWAALGGGKAAPEQPIHQGQREAQVSVRVGDLTVTRRFTAKGSTLVVVGADGMPRRSPQGILDQLYTHLGFDPLEFMNQSAATQAETLRRLVGLDFSDLEAKHREFYEERTAVNKTVKSLQARYEMAAHWPDVAESVSVAVLSGQLRAATDEIRANDIERGRLRSLREQLATQKREAGELEQRIRELQQRLANVRSTIEATESREAMQAEVVAGLVDPDTASITRQIEDAETINRKARENKEREALKTELDDNKAHADRLTSELEAIADEKVVRLSMARFPVSGLSVDGDTVTLNGVPLSQSSMAERVKACLAISAALQPRLKVVLVREGSFLDKSNLRVVAEWAKEHGFQVFMERVGDKVEGSGVLIEDGRVAGRNLPVGGQTENES